GLAVGLIGTLYGGLGVAQALQNALNRVWTVPRNRRPNPIKARLRSLGLLGVLGAGVVLTSVLSALSSAARSYGAELGAGVRVLLVVAAVLVNVALFLAAFRALTARSVTTRQVLPGAVIAGVSWQLLQSVGTYYIGHTLRGATEIYGLFGLVLGLVAWLHLEALVVVLSAEINVVLARRLWPRSLLTPFTDNVSLTPADEAAYSSYADTETYKGFEEVSVQFDPAHRSGSREGTAAEDGPITPAAAAPIKE
ncbi:MAG: YihY/virulence factor BrkB family protein, partial [Actinomycetota bacterium]|nr:YihY/virulence factor BrkB family protein [Actinomycetota bacterium]